MSGRSLAGLALASLTLAAAHPAAALAPPVLKWQRGGCLSSWCQTGWYASPAIADLDGDGAAEVVSGSYDLTVLAGATGALKWRAPNGSRVWPGVAVADLTGDGTLEIVVGRGSDQLTVYDRLGGVVWSANPFGGGEIRTLAVEDLEHDGAFEIIVGRASGGETKQISAYNADGTVRPGWPARRDGEPGFGWGMYNQNVTVADLNGDGFREVVGPTDTHYITALDRAGNQLPVNPIYTGRTFWSQVGVHVDHAVDLRGYANCGTEHRPNFADSAPVIADVNGDGQAEIVVVGNVYNCGTRPYTSLYQMPFIFRMDRTRWSGSGFDWTAIPVPGPGSGPLSEDYNVIETVQPNPVVADLDGDGRKEILFASYDGKLHAYWLDKTEHGAWPYTIIGGGIRFASEPVVADLDGNGTAEVIFASWPEKAGAGTGHLFILDAAGSPLLIVGLPPSFPAGSWNGGLAAPTLGDIDGDPDLEVVVSTSQGGVAVYDLPGTANARVLWSTGRGSVKRSGVEKAGREYRSGFVDVPPWNAFYRSANRLALSGVTGGCNGNPPLFCPASSVTRAQMAVFLLRSKEGQTYQPPPCAAPSFLDVPCSNPYAAWIYELAARGVTSGCGGGNYCPDASVTRGQMAVFLLRTKEGGGYAPPACMNPGFADVSCSHPFAAWIYELARRGITAGCGGGNYCPEQPNARGPMAAFLVTTFGLR